MARKHCLVKISGDVLLDKVLEWIKLLSTEYFVVVCVGGGTQINEAFQKAGYPLVKFGPLGRETKTFEERQLARDILEENQRELQDRLAKMGVHVTVEIPVIYVGSVLCHVNGDQYTLSSYHGFDLLYVVTTDDRVGAKTAQFAEFPKIRVVSPGSLPSPMD